jgi:hypothetical protein
MEGAMPSSDDTVNGFILSTFVPAKSDLMGASIPVKGNKVRPFKIFLRFIQELIYLFL